MLGYAGGTGRGKGWVIDTHIKIVIYNLKVSFFCIFLNCQQTIVQGLILIGFFLYIYLQSMEFLDQYLMRLRSKRIKVFKKNTFFPELSAAKRNASICLKKNDIFRTHDCFDL